MYHIMINKINDLISISLSYIRRSHFMFIVLYTDVLQDHIDYIVLFKFMIKSLLVQI